jgi:esterase/lipase superfamily enzyme
LLTLLAAVLGILILGILLINTTTERALERAEAFGFSRMLVARQEEEEPIYRFFFVTNRDRSTGDHPLDELSNNRGDLLTYGHFDTSIEPSLGLGMLINPTDWFQNEEIKLIRRASLERADFVAELKRQADASPHRGLLVVVHGFRERFPSALKKTAFVGHVLDLDAPLVAFDWPGNQGSTPGGYRRAQAIARESGADLAAALRTLILEVQSERVWVLANSMGGEVVVSAFSELYRDPEFKDAQAEFDNVVLTAPDVSHEEFGTRFADEIAALTDNLTVYVSSNDRALLMSRLINRERRLGQSTLNPTAPDQLASALKTLELIEPDSEHVTLVDVTPINRTRNFHNFSLETPEFFDDLYLRLVNDQIPKSRPQHRLQTPSGKQYWVLAPAR